MLSFEIRNTNYKIPLVLDVIFDDQYHLKATPVVQPISLTIPLSDDPNSHTLVIQLSGKTPEHTIIDNGGQIISDVMLSIENIKMDDIDISLIFYKQSMYVHSYNTQDQSGSYHFYRYMGCNGNVFFKFSTPYYVWLLDNM